VIAQIVRAVTLLLLVVLPATARADTKATPQAVVARYEQEFKNKNNHAIVMELFAADYKGYGVQPTPIDRAQLKALGDAVSAAFPDVKADVQDTIVSGDKVVTRVVAQGTHKGPFNGIPATGKHVTWTEIHIYRVKDGKIVESWSQIDFLGLLTQLGAIPPPKH